MKDEKIIVAFAALLNINGVANGLYICVLIKCFFTFLKSDLMTTLTKMKLS